MEIKYRRIDLNNKTELRFIVENDIAIPAKFDPSFKVDEKTILEHLERTEKVKEEDFFDLAVTSEGEIVGFHHLKKIPHFETFAGLVYTLWVSPKFRKQGIAKTLKERAEVWARKLQLDHIHTFVHVDNTKMLSVNQKQGFEVAYYKMMKKL